jgi:hypothetical protein
MKKDIQISNELNDVFEALKAPFNIVSITENSGISTIVTDTIRIFDNLCITMDLQDGMIVTIGDKNYQVDNVTHTPQEDSFTIAKTGISGTEWNVAANFHSGGRTEINEILQQERTDNNKFKRFPLVWYIYRDDRDYDNEAIDFEAPVNLAFAYKSNETDKTVDRIDNNITPILQPLIKLFQLWIQSSDFYYLFEFNGHGRALDATTKNFPFYGITENRKNVLETPSDAIELEINLKFKKQYY